MIKDSERHTRKRPGPTESREVSTTRPHGRETPIACTMPDCDGTVPRYGILCTACYKKVHNLDTPTNED